MTSVIDLTQDSPSGTTAATTNTARLSMSQLGTSSTCSREDEEHDPADEEEEEEDSSLLLLGSMQCSIVGIRYYRGVAHPGEFVHLVREPTNPYDRNAVRVDNLAHQKVGHIKATVAKALAPVLDQLAVVNNNNNGIARIKVDGTIPRQGNEYTQPLNLEFFGRDASDMERIGAIFQRHRQRWQKNPALVRRNSNSNGSAAAAPAVQTASKTLDWKSAQQQLDDMFEKASKEQLAHLPDVAIPETLTAQLLEHQVQGFRWLYKRETDTSAASVPFYKQVRENGKLVWLSEITNSSQETPPAPCKGSILADDMGMGKTMQAIALMLANAPEPDASAKKTLIVCPVSVLPNWIQQIEQHTKPGTLKVAVYHGADRYERLQEADVDVLVASYGTLSTDYGNEFPNEARKAKGNTKKPEKKKARRTKGPSIFDVTFHRVILDEAHTPRNTKSRTFASCKKLEATYRLALTGTPLQNKPEDLHSLFSFLQMEPLGDRNIFRRAIAQPIQNGEPVGLARLRAMMAHVALRRNKNCLDLVPKTVEMRSVVFPDDCAHKRIHDVLFETAQTAFRATLSAGNDKAVMKNMMMILETLTRIRQACVSGNLVPKERLAVAEKVLDQVKGMDHQKLTAQEGEELLKKLKGAFEEDEGCMECAICLEEMVESGAVILRSCGHLFCEPCLSRCLASCRGTCPLCRQKFQPADMIKKSVALSAASQSEERAPSLAESMHDIGDSPKLKALGQAMDEMKEDEKGVIFCQFTTFLDLIEPFLTARGQTFCRIDGKKSSPQRIEAMWAFQAEGGPRFILCSLQAAGTGITLTRANHCFMLSPWFNLSVEQQAMDRVHRIGQTRNVRVVRFCMKDSIEEKMIELQEAKAAIGKGAMEKLKPEEMRKARIGDLKSLFNLDK